MVFMILVQLRDWTPSVYLRSHELEEEEEDGEGAGRGGASRGRGGAYLSHSLMGSREATGMALIMVTFLL